MPALQICYHDHCFDGVASAATFLRFYREKVKPGIADVSLRGMAHRAGQLFPPEAFAGDENAVVDFRFSADPGSPGGSITTRARSRPRPTKQLSRRTRAAASSGIPPPRAARASSPASRRRSSAGTLLPFAS